MLEPWLGRHLVGEVSLLQDDLSFVTVLKLITTILIDNDTDEDDDSDILTFSTHLCV